MHLVHRRQAGTISDAIDERFREGTRLDDVAVAIDVAEHRTIALEGACNGFILSEFDLEGGTDTADFHIRSLLIGPPGGAVVPILIDLREDLRSEYQLAAERLDLRDVEGGVTVAERDVGLILREIP